MRGFTTEQLESSPCALGGIYDAYKGMHQCDECRKWFDDEGFQEHDGGDYGETCDNCYNLFLASSDGLGDYDRLWLSDLWEE